MEGFANNIVNLKYSLENIMEKSLIKAEFMFHLFFLDVDMQNPHTFNKKYVSKYLNLRVNQFWFLTCSPQ